MKVDLTELLQGKHIVLDIHVNIVEDEPEHVDEFEAYKLEELPDDPNMEAMEKGNIHRALFRNHGNRKKAAEDLHMSERTLFRKIEKYGLNQEVRK